MAQPATEQAPHIRASDEDREHTAAFLRRHCGEGRLTPDELSERLDAAYGARTLGELARLRVDLPAEVGPLAPPVTARPARRWRVLAIAAGAVGLVFVAASLAAAPWSALWFGAAIVILVFMLVFALACAAPIVAVVGGTAWLVRRLWRRAEPPLELER